MTFSIVKKAAFAALTAASVLAAMPAAACTIVETNVNGVANVVGLGSAWGCNHHAVGILGNGNGVQSTTDGHWLHNGAGIIGNNNTVNMQSSGFANATDVYVETDGATVNTVNEGAFNEIDVVIK